MSLWGMNDGTTATGKTTVTNGNAAIAGVHPQLITSVQTE